MTKTKISLFAGAAVIVAGGLVLAIRTNPSTAANDGHGTIGAPATYKAEISMSFRAGDTQMTPGSYEFNVSLGSVNPVILVRKADGSAKAMLLPTPGSDAPKAWQNDGKPKISFNCVDGACTLARLWSGQGVSTLDFPGPKLTAAEKERVAAVDVGLTRAD
jgi:hypothetical protein